jgi:hypothetical protein
MRIWVYIHVAVNTPQTNRRANPPLLSRYVPVAALPKRMPGDA